MAVKPVTNKQYNFYTVIDDSITTYKHGGRQFHVRCECGKEEYKLAKHLESGRCKSCKSCASKRTAVKHPPPILYKGVGGLSMTHFSSISNGAKKRGIPFQLDIGFLWELYLSQDGRCGLTGLPISLEPAIKGCNVDWSKITASVDRIDNSIGYLPGNVWWVHKEVNRLKNNYSLDELLFWCSKIIATHGNPEPSSAKEIIVAEKVQRLGDEDSNQ